MKAVFTKAPYRFEIRDVELREPGQEEALIKVIACGICGGDVGFAGTDAQDWQPFGHEVSGIVIKTGANCANVSAGDKVVLESGSFCRECELCRNGRVDLCNKGPNFWNSTSMGFAEYMIAPKECLVPFSGISFEEAALVEPLGVALDLFYTAGVQFNDSVLVAGIGPIGLMAIQLSKAAGAKRIYAAAHSHSKARIGLAEKFGADEIVFTDKTGIESYVYSGGGVDKVMLTAPPRLIPACMKASNLGGTIAYIGFAGGNDAQVTFDANEFHVKKLQLKASFAAPALYFPRAIELIQRGAVDVKSLISNRFRLEEIESAMRALCEDKCNSVKSVMVAE
ncbi:MAG TPA: alcohol dehydrogenase catalytic domain-containing protein [Clostridia bacterium]|nr:alcohol dehydrogenase catalytic domain-containing protein [Clostridia bacterium]